MKAFGAVAALILFCASASFAQISVQGEDGSTVTIGPGGININGQGTRSNVRMNPGGIQIDSNDGYNRSRVNLGPGMTVQTSRGAATKTVKTVTKRAPAASVKTTTINTGTRTYVSPVVSGGPGPNAEDQITIIEMKIYGKPSAGKPLIARVEKLEIDNLGQKGSGPLKTRINILAKELGVNITGASTTIVNSGGSTVAVTSSNPESISVNVREGSSATNTYVAGPVLTDMVINENNQIIKGHCNGNFIVLNGNNCQLQLSGTVGEVTINGNHNHIKSDRLGIVVANGNNNSVTWSHHNGAPSVQNNGKDNAIHQQ